MNKIKIKKSKFQHINGKTYVPFIPYTIEVLIKKTSKIRL